jgi:hypothetical protein
MLISVEGKAKNYLEPGKGGMGDAPVLSHYYLLRNHWPKPNGVLEHCQLLVLHLWECFLLTASLGQWRMSLYISLFTVAIPLNYTIEFQELFEATLCVCVRARARALMDNILKMPVSEGITMTLGSRYHVCPIIFWNWYIFLENLGVGKKRSL